MIHGYNPEPIPEATEGSAFLGPQPYFAGSTLGPGRPDTLRLATPLKAVAEDGFLSFRHATRFLKAMEACSLEIHRSCVPRRPCVFNWECLV